MPSFCYGASLTSVLIVGYADDVSALSPFHIARDISWLASM